MKISVFDTHKYDQNALEKENEKYKFQINFLEARLTEQSALLAKGSDIVCCFVNDRLNAKTLKILKEMGVKLIALRSAGFNHVDLKVAHELGLKVVRVPEYSPYAVAEHAVALLSTLNRKIHRAYNRVHEMNFSLEGLTGYDLHGKTVGILGTGKIGKVFAKIMYGFGCHLIAYDKEHDQKLVSDFKVKYVDLDKIYTDSDIISLHIPLTPETHHIINTKAFKQMKQNVVLINTGRGGLIDTKALIQSLKSHTIAGACLDVYEEEDGVFFSDLSGIGIQDDLLARLLTFPNVLITAHQAFLTEEALSNIAETTLMNIKEFSEGSKLSHEVLPSKS